MASGWSAALFRHPRHALAGSHRVGSLLSLMCTINLPAFHLNRSAAR